MKYPEEILRERIKVLEEALEFEKGEEMTMTDDTPPDWVLIKAAKRAGLHLTPAQYRAGLIAKSARPYFRALCDMILKHEKPPVDRKILCAHEALREANGADEYVRWTSEQIIVRAIELWEEGFGNDQP
jgi:hypothetical protein